jgi:hypothetical protein
MYEGLDVPHVLCACDVHTSSGRPYNRYNIDITKTATVNVGIKYL